MSSQEPTPIRELSHEECRQKLAGLIAPEQAVADDRRAEIKQAAIDFVAILPHLFGDELERTTLWDRIGSGLQAALAKTASSDHEFFVQCVLSHILANPTKAASNSQLCDLLDKVDAWTDVDRQAWMQCFGTHLIPILVHARASWEEIKEKSKQARKLKTKGGKSPNAVDPETLKSFV